MINNSLSVAELQSAVAELQSVVAVFDKIYWFVDIDYLLIIFFLN